MTQLGVPVCQLLPSYNCKRLSSWKAIFLNISSTLIKTNKKSKWTTSPKTKQQNKCKETKNPKSYTFVRSCVTLDEAVPNNQGQGRWHSHFNPSLQRVNVGRFSFSMPHFSFWQTCSEGVNKLADKLINIRRDPCIPWIKWLGKWEHASIVFR